MRIATPPRSLVAWTLVGVLIALGLTFAGDVRERSFDVEPGGLLDVDATCGGDITIEGWSEDRVEVRAELTGRDADNIRLVIEETSRGVEVSARFPSGTRDKANVNLEIRVPEQYDVKVNSMGGDLRMRGISGEFRGQTMGGRLDLSDLDGRVKLTTMGGGIELKDSTVDGTVSTMGGNVVIRNVEGNIEGSSMGGSVRYDNVRRTGSTPSVAPRAERRSRPAQGRRAPAAPLVLDTQGGKIEVGDAPHGARLETMGGSIRAGRVGRFIKAETMGGRITIEEVDGRVDVSTLGGGVDITLVETGDADSYDVEISAIGGDVRLVVPEDFSMNVDIEISYTKKSKRNYRINSDFNLDETRTDEWEYSDGDPRKYIRARGRVSGGKYRVHITNVNGNVHLLEAS